MSLRVYLVSLLRRSWERIQRPFAVLARCRFAALCVAIPVAMLVVVPQGVEIARILISDRALVATVALTGLMAVLWAANAWYWARTMLSLHLPEFERHDSASVAWWAHRIPRWLGAFGLLGLGAAFLRAGLGEGATTAAHARAVSLFWAAGTCALMAIVFWGAVKYRRPALRRVAQRFQASPVSRFTSAFAAIPEAAPVNAIRNVRALPRASRAWVIGTFSVSVLLFLLFLINPVAFASRVGSMAILLAAAASWIPFGSLLDWKSMQWRVPIVTLGIVWVALMSRINDNHDVRRLDGAVAPREELGARLSQWLAARRREQPSGRIPLFVAAAEGGGIRAAYWTATVLASLQDADSGFARHVFAVSGVSGGALGGAAFATASTHADTSCHRGARGPVECRVDRLLSGDFLAPLLGAMLYPDLVQRALPRLPWFSSRADRAAALETAWERRDPSFKGAFDSLWSGDHAARIPALVFTGTTVETGKRIMTVAPFHFSFGDAADGESTLGAPMRVSTAVHMSARFTYFSPAGRLPTGHVVDGGYFDNSGAIAAEEIMDAVRSALGKDTASVIIVPVIIENDVEATAAPRAEWLNEALSPVRAMLNARSARASLAKARLARDPHAIRFTLGCPEVTLPLGWALSALDREEMHRQLTAVCTNGADNAAARKTVDSLLR